MRNIFLATLLTVVSTAAFAHQAPTPTTSGAGVVGGSVATSSASGSFDGGLATNGSGSARVSASSHNSATNTNTINVTRDGALKSVSTSSTTSGVSGNASSHGVGSSTYFDASGTQNAAGGTGVIGGAFQSQSFSSFGHGHNND